MNVITKATTDMIITLLTDQVMRMTAAAMNMIMMITEAVTQTAATMRSGIVHVQPARHQILLLSKNGKISGPHI